MFAYVGSASGVGMSPTEMLSQLVEAKGLLAEARRQQETSRIAVDQLMSQVEAKAAEMEDQQVGSDSHRASLR